MIGRCFQAVYLSGNVNWSSVSLLAMGIRQILETESFPEYCIRCREVIAEEQDICFLTFAFWRDACTERCASTMGCDHFRFGKKLLWKINCRSSHGFQVFFLFLFVYNLSLLLGLSAETHPTPFCRLPKAHGSGGGPLPFGRLRHPPAPRMAQGPTAAAAALLLEYRGFPM